ncbi:MAG: hypothetical protein AAF968_20040 [Pseudomonadota bacterium]
MAPSTLFGAILPVALATLAPVASVAEPMTRDHDELPRVIACQERLQAAIDAMRIALRGYDLALEITAAERPETARSETIVTCRLIETDNVPALTQTEAR